MFITRILKLLGREFRVIWSDWKLAGAVFIMPIAYFALFGLLYVPRRATNVPIYIIDQDKSSLSRSIITAARHNELLEVRKIVDSEEEFRDGVLRRDTYALIWIPQNFQHDIKKGRPAKLLTVLDGTNIMNANYLVKAISTISGTYSVGVELKKLNMKGTPREHTLAQAAPIDNVTKVLYNPELSYNIFILVGIVGTIIQSITMLGIAIAYSREHQMGLFHTYYLITDSALEVVIAKGIFYTLANLTTSSLAFLIGLKYFGMQLNGSPLLCYSLLATFIFAIVALGLCVSAACNNETFAVQILMMISLPSFLLSGFTWPHFAMITPIRLLSYVFPLTHFVMPMRTIFMQDGGFEYIKHDMLWLWTLATCSYIGMYIAVYISMTKAKKKTLEGTYSDRPILARGKLLALKHEADRYIRENAGR